MKKENKMVIDYRLNPRDFLSRARKLLDEKKCSSLFYAALELRFCYEIRVAQYGQYFEDISNKKKKGWKPDNLMKEIEKKYKQLNYSDILELTFYEEDKEEILHTFYYVPISLEVKRAYRKLNELLHVPKDSPINDESWWLSKIEFLENLYGGLKKVVSGNLYGPFLITDGKFGEMTTDSNDAEKEVIMKIFKKMKVYTVKFNYIKELPKDFNRVK